MVTVSNGLVPGMVTAINTGIYIVQNASLNLTHLAPEVDDDGEDPGMDIEIQVLQQRLKYTRFIVQRILVPLVVSFGVIGNIMNIAVLTRRWMRSSTNIYLTALAIFDILYLVFSLLMSFKHYETIKGADWYTHFAKPYGKPLIDTWSNTAVWLTVTLTVERYIGICMPMKGKVICTPERARTIVIIVCIVTAIITAPEFFQYRAVWEQHADNTSTLTVITTKFAEHPTYQWGYNYTNQVLYTFLPLLLLIVVNSLLIRTVMLSARARRHMTKVAVVKNDKQERHHSEQQKITIMLIAIVAVFLCCQIPQAVLNLYVTYLVVLGRMTLRHKIILTILANIFNLLVMLNSSSNFILYSSFSIKFRRTFRRLFCGCVDRRRHSGAAKAKREALFSDGYSTDGCKTTLIIQHQNSSTRLNAVNRNNSCQSNTTGSSSNQNGRGSCSNNGPNTVHVAYNSQNRFQDHHAQRLVPLRSKNGYQEVSQNTNDPKDTFISAV